MDHLHFLLLILPAMTCLNWAIFHTVYAFRTDTYRIVLLLMLTCFMVLTVDALFDTPGVSLHTVAWSNLLAQFAAPSIIPLAILYLVQLRMGALIHSVLRSVWIIIPAAMFTGGALLYGISSASEIEQILETTYEHGWLHIAAYRGTVAYIYYIWTFIVFRSVLIIEAILLVGYMIYIMRKDKLSVRRLFDFLFKKGSITVMELQMFNIILNLILSPLKLLPMKHFVDTHPTIIVALDLSLVTVLALFGMIALLGARKEITLKDVFNCLLYNYGKETKEEFLRYRADTLLDQADLETRRFIRSRLDEHEQDLQPKADTVDESESPTISERLFATAAASWGSDSMQAEFDRLMTEEKLFLNPKLRLDDIAERLHTNKTYVSRMVNQSYEMGFSELINIMRIDFAEQFITRNTKAKQAEIAEACGFISASAFNSIFKKVTGMTPKAWIAQWNSANETL